MKKEAVLVSVCMVTGNQQAYLREAIESVLAQQTSFAFELILTGPATDAATAETCRWYRDRFQDKIRWLGQAAGASSAHFEQALNAAQGRYIAICEGENFWTDPLKLQKQVDFLEQHPEFSGCFHRVDVFVQWTGKRGAWHQVLDKKKVFHLEPFLSRFYLNNTSLVFRQQPAYPAWIFQHNFYDYPLSLYLLTKGPFFYMDAVMACYRKHQASANYEGETQVTAVLKAALLAEKAAILHALNEATAGRYLPKIQQALRSWETEYDYKEALRKHWPAKLYGFSRQFIRSKDILNPRTYKSYFMEMSPGLYNRLFQLKSRLRQRTPAS